MTEHFGRALSEFYITLASPCPYLPERKERKVFTILQNPSAGRANDLLTQRGYRRSQNIIYRPACDQCEACVPVRIPTARFTPSRSQRRIAARNSDLAATIRPCAATEEQFSVLRSYLDARHLDGGMADMTIMDYSAMVEETAVDTFLVEYRDITGRLMAVALTDRLSNGLSMVYSFFDPAQSHRSLGVYMIMEHVARAAAAGLDHVYLGYWVAGSPKMDYKARFKPLERLASHGWELLDAASEPATSEPNAPPHG